MPRKTLKQRQEKNPTDDKSNRIRPALDNLIGIEDPDDLMIEILKLLQEGGKVPQAGKLYIFIYNAKTPDLQYDQNPLVAVTNVFSWGFRGVNVHWRERRNYTWSEIAGGLYEISREELKDLKALPFKKLR